MNEEYVHNKYLEPRQKVDINRIVFKCTTCFSVITNFRGVNHIHAENMPVILRQYAKVYLKITGRPCTVPSDIVIMDNQIQ